jgi:DNA-binding MarR family transcriptional regulator
MLPKTFVASPSSTKAIGVLGPEIIMGDTSPAILGDSSRALRSAVMDPRMIVLHGTLLSLVRRDGRDLTARQLTAFLTVYMDDTTHTVSSLAELLHISRPGVTRIMDRLVQFDLVAREEDREDRRRVLVRRTTRGAVFFRELVSIARSVPTEADEVPTAAVA